jgi:PhnB protein
MATKKRNAKSKATTAKKSPSRAAAAKKTARGAAAAKKPARKPAAKKKAAVKKKASAIPTGYHTLTPYLVVRGADAAIALYQKAFGARLKLRMGMPDGSVMHAELQIGDSMFMLSEENPAWDSKSPLLLGGSAAHAMIYTKDVDALFARATAAGCSVVMPPTDMFWGDRYAKITDPFGHPWSLGTHIEDVGPKEMARRAEEWGKQMAAQQGAAANG